MLPDAVAQLLLSSPASKRNRGAMPRAERHRQAVAQSLRCAEDAAAAGEFGDALDWLRLIDYVDGGLSPFWQRRRESWLLALERR